MQTLSERAGGRWEGLLPQFGVDPSFLTGKHTGCPLCKAGKDRFRFDNQDGRGTWICSACGAGDGVSLVMRINGWTFREAAPRIEQLVGSVKPVKAKFRRSDEEHRDALNRLWANTRRASADDPVGRWLKNRVGLTDIPRCLRYVERMRYEADPPSLHPGMVAMVTGHDERPATLHRTYLTDDGRKAAVEAPRRLMPGKAGKGVSVKLFTHDGVLGVAEGIETALAASRLFSVPCWAVLNTGMMVQWVPPSDVREVIVFGDNDPAYGGQAAAYGLAHRLAAGGKLKVRVEIPPRVKSDWNDILLEDGT